MRLKSMVLVILAWVVLYPAIMPVFAAETRLMAPRVVYSAPDNDSVIDLTGKKTLTFAWKSMPTPAGGRSAYRITVYKGFSYDVVFTQDLDPEVFSVEVPVEKFDDGLTYSWIVKQRDASSSQWSRYNSWSFKAKKAK